MLKWLLELFKGGEGGGTPSPAEELASLLEERRRLAEILASYREFGFEAQSEGCTERLRHVRARIRGLHDRPGVRPAEPRGGRG